MIVLNTIIYDQIIMNKCFHHEHENIASRKIAYRSLLPDASVLGHSKVLAKGILTIELPAEDSVLPPEFLGFRCFVLARPSTAKAGRERERE